VGRSPRYTLARITQALSRAGITGDLRERFLHYLKRLPARKGRPLRHPAPTPEELEELKRREEQDEEVVERLRRLEEDG
jgi:hypothetical protein